MESYHFSSITVNIGSGKNCQWMLNLEGNLDQEKDISLVLKYLFTDCSLIMRGKKQFNYAVENWATP